MKHLALMLALGACFAPDIPNGTVPCGPNGECPSGFACKSGLCSNGSVTGGGADAPVVVHDGPLVDAFGPFDDAGPPPDAAPDAGPTGHLIIDFQGTGGGSIMANGRSCGADCTLAFPLGTSVTVTEAPSGNSGFGGWGGACTGSGSCTVMIDGDKNLSVTFTPNSVQVMLITSIVGPGTVTLAPAGTSCGAGCAMFPMGTMVRLSPVPGTGLSFISWSGGGCDTQPGDCTTTLIQATTVVATFCAFNAVVDPTGKDTNAGTCAAPYQTVTKALAGAASGQTVSVRPGTYSTASGETFPLVVPAGVTLVGDEPSQGNGAVATRLQGGGVAPGTPFISAAVVLAKNATLAGFLVVDSLDSPSASGVAVVDVNGFASDSATIRSNTISMSMADGVVLYHGAGVTVSKNFINKNSGDGVHIFDGAAGALLDGNVISQNGYGVEVIANADLGGGTSPGGNTLACNTHTDLLASGTITVMAKNDSWDHVPPTTGCDAGADLCQQQGATVTLDGATQAPMCP